MKQERRWGWAVTAVLVGCASTGVGNPGLTDTEEALYETGNDATREGDTATSLVSVSILALSDEASVSNEVVASSAVESRTPLYFEPAGCLSLSRSGPTVTFDFQDCRTGAFGLAAVRGTMVATYSAGSAGGVDVSISTPSTLTLGSASVSLSAQASYTVVGARRTLVWNGGYHATRLLRPDIDHLASYRVEYDASTQCLSLSGSATTTLATGSGSTSNLVDYLRCGAKTSCPKAGTLTLSGLPNGDTTMVVEYLGGSSVRVRVPKRAVEVSKALACDG